MYSGVMRAWTASILTILAIGLMGSNSALIEPSDEWPLDKEWADSIFGPQPSQADHKHEIYGPVVLDPAQSFQFEKQGSEHLIVVGYHEKLLSITKQSEAPHTIAIHNEAHGELLVVHLMAKDKGKTIETRDLWHSSNPTAAFHIGSMQHSHDKKIDYSSGFYYTTE